MRLFRVFLLCALGCAALLWALRPAETAGESSATENSPSSGRESGGEAPVGLVAPATSSTSARNALEGIPGNPAAPQEDPASRLESTWAEKYRGWSAQELLALSRTMSIEVGTKVSKVTPAMFKSGEGVFWVAGKSFNSEMGQKDELRSIVNKDGNHYEVVLPRDKWPELYAMKAESNWLYEAARLKLSSGTTDR